MEVWVGWKEHWYSRQLSYPEWIQAAYRVASSMHQVYYSSECRATIFCSKINTKWQATKYNLLSAILSHRINYDDVDNVPLRNKIYYLILKKIITCLTFENW